MKKVINLILYLIKKNIVLKLNIIVFFYYLFLKYIKLVTDKKRDYNSFSMIVAVEFNHST